MTGGLRASAPALRRFVRGRGGLARKGTAWLHPKHGPRFYYKGNRARNLGWHTRRGGYMIDWKNKVPEFVCPDLSDNDLLPYVSARTPKIKIPPPPMPES